MRIGSEMKTEGQRGHEVRDSEREREEGNGQRKCALE